MEPALTVEGVGRRFGDTVALDDVSLSVSPGEVLVLVGPNGAGKTTLVRVATGTETPDDGSVELLGEPPSAVDREAVGVLPQSFSPPDRLTARELLGYYAGLYDDPRDPADLLETVGLADAADTEYRSLSGGQQRRVCIGATLVNDPDVVVLDEPTTGIDPAGRRTVRAQIADLAAAGAAVLVTTHDMDEAERLADRVALLDDGRLRALDAPAALIEAYGGSPRLRVTLTREPERADAPAAGQDSAGSEGDDAPIEETVESARRALSDAGFERVDRAARERGTLVVDDVAPESIASVVAALEDAGVAFERLAWEEPSLEDAYVALTEGEGRPGASPSPGDPAAPGGDRT